MSGGTVRLPIGRPSTYRLFICKHSFGENMLDPVRKVESGGRLFEVNDDAQDL